MTVSSALYTYAILAASPSPSPSPGGGAGTPNGVNFTGLSVILGIIGGLVVMVAGIAIANRGKKGNFKQAADSGGAVMVGIIIFAIGSAFTVAAGGAGKLVSWFFQ